MTEAGELGIAPLPKLKRHSPGFLSHTGLRARTELRQRPGASQAPLGSLGVAPMQLLSSRSLRRSVGPH